MIDTERRDEVLARVRAQPVIMGIQRRQIEREHAVVIALECDPVFPGRRAAHQMIDHAPAIGTTIHQIAQMDDGCFWHRMVIAVDGDQFMRMQQQIKMAVNVAYGVAAHLDCPFRGR